MEHAVFIGKGFPSRGWKYQFHTPCTVIMPPLFMVDRLICNWRMVLVINGRFQIWRRIRYLTFEKEDCKC